MTRHLKTPPFRRGGQSRKCLMCGEKFESEGAHNRICHRCKLTRSWREGAMDCTTHAGKRRS